MSNLSTPLTYQDLQQDRKTWIEKFRREKANSALLERRAHEVPAKQVDTLKHRREADAVATHAKYIKGLRAKNSGDARADAAVKLRMIRERATDRKLDAEWEKVEGEDDDDWEKVSKEEADERQDAVASSGMRMSGVSGGLQ